MKTERIYTDLVNKRLNKALDVIGWGVITLAVLYFGAHLVVFFLTH